jgi:dynein heavy chain
LGKDTSWPSAKKELADPSFLKRLKEFDKDNMNERLIKKIEKFTHRSDMGDIKSVSEAAFCLWNWV